MSQHWALDAWDNQSFMANPLALMMQSKLFVMRMTNTRLISLIQLIFMEKVKMYRWPKVKKISIFCGRGDNGGQGYVLAQQEKKWEWSQQFGK
ncbi:TPA: NAD(P)H-hydrate epimerase [Legionella pneumophila]|uniref:NAD(P)H-hydrate epimerase n=1 Tax=Legionella pneumophila TaxID=446 RepID=UPI0002FC369E|nr:NAD(P)H-hydrate epimerase [Legionella pneumophila]